MIGSYRFSVSRMIPRMTQVALQTHKKDLMRETPNFAGSLAVGADTLTLPNRDFDTGNLTRAAEYTLTDGTYAKLLAQLSDREFNLTSPELRANILDFYSDLSAPIDTKAMRFAGGK